MFKTACVLHELETQLFHGDGGRFPKSAEEVKGAASNLEGNGQRYFAELITLEAQCSQTNVTSHKPTNTVQSKKQSSKHQRTYDSRPTWNFEPIAAKP